MGSLIVRGLTGAALASMCGIAGAQQALAPDTDNAADAASIRVMPPRFVIDTGVQTSTILATGEEIALPTQMVWKPICSNKAPMTAADLQTMAGTHAAAFADPNTVTIVNTRNMRAGLNIVFSLGAGVPAASLPAFATAEAYMEGQFPNDTVTVTITVSFANLGSGVIGGTSSAYGYVDWATSRSVLVGGVDASDTIQAFLPGGTTVPVRYATNTTTNENRIFWSLANWKAAGGTASGTDANMQFSTVFPFDWDPSNGVTANTISFQDVIIHEVGHALGFGSGVDFRVKDIETLDIFRFRNTDGSGSNDFNPDTTAEFTARPRWAVKNNPNNDVNFDIISTEIVLSDGSPWQASHWREGVPAVGIMDPAFNYAETFYPNFFRTTDLTGFDAIGWDK